MGNRKKVFKYKDMKTQFCMIVKPILQIVLLVLYDSEYADVHYWIANILDDRFDHVVVALYVATLSAGTYIG
jgi:hypothetical protein